MSGLHLESVWATSSSSSSAWLPGNPSSSSPFCFTPCPPSFLSNQKRRKIEVWKTSVGYLFFSFPTSLPSIRWNWPSGGCVCVSNQLTIVCNLYKDPRYLFVNLPVYWIFTAFLFSPTTIFLTLLLFYYLFFLLFCNNIRIFLFAPCPPAYIRFLSTVCPAIFFYGQLPNGSPFNQLEILKG